MRTPEKKEYEGIHLLRVLACFMVVLLHVSAPYFSKFSVNWDAGLFYDACTRGCVPLFIMITGFLLLPRQEDCFLFYRKRLTRIFPPLFFYSAIYFFLIHGTLLGFQKAFLLGPTGFHLWYLYMLCGLYFAMPFLQKMYAQSSRRELLVILAAWAALHLLFPALSVLPLPKYNPRSIFHLTTTGYWGYAVLGAFLGTLSSRYRFLGIALYVTGSGFTILTAYYFSAQKGTPAAPFMEHITISTALAAAGIFLLLKDAKIRMGKKLILQLSGCSFGIYLVHILILEQIQRVTPEWFYDLSPWIFMPLLAVAVFAVSFAIIYPLKKIKYLRAIVG